MGDVSGLHEGGWLKVEIGGTDTGGNMSEAVEEKAFPHVFKARHGRDEAPTDDELREAVRAHSPLSSKPERVKMEPAPIDVMPPRR